MKVYRERLAAIQLAVNTGQIRLIGYTLLKLMLKWSPEQIAMRMRLVFAGEVDMRISHETIYKWVYELKAKSIS